MGDLAGTVAVAGRGEVATELAGGLRDLGATVIAIRAMQDFDAALEAAGPLDGLVWAAAEASFGTPKPLAELDATEWKERAEAPLRAFVEFLQAAHRRLRVRGGRIVTLIPTIAMDGAAGLTPWAAVADGQRALIKSAARVWGADGIALNCVALPASLMVTPAAGGRLSRPGLQQPALADPGVRTEVAGVVASMLGPAYRAVTGATVAVDGGRWMTP
jgi:hypothetical protein